MSFSFELKFYCRSEEETSGDEAEDHDSDEENGEEEEGGGEGKTLEQARAAQIQKL